MREKCVLERCNVMERATFKRNRIDDLTLPVGSAEIVGLAEGLLVG